ncbi:MAG: hypothetical protein FJX77_10530, partial [Armatimonadetes bacterium]|nr:hypothetical protein [Armatimonadota bacterium]
MGGTVARPLLTGEVTADPFSVEGLRVDRPVARVRWDGEDRIEIEEATCRLPFGDLRAQGTISPGGDLDLRVAGAGLNLARLLRDHVPDPPQAQLFAELEVGGRVEAPTVRGAVQLYDIRAGPYEMDYGEAEVVLQNLHRVQVSALKLNRGGRELQSESLVFWQPGLPGETDPEGDPAAQTEWQVAGTVRPLRMTLIQALRWLGVGGDDLKESPLGGELAEVEIRLEGPLAAPRVRVAARAEDCVVRGHDLGVVTAVAEWDGSTRRLRIVGAESLSSEGSVSFSGEIGWETAPTAPDGTPPRLQPGPVDLTFRVQNVRLLPLLRRYAPGVLDDVDLQGSLAEVAGQVTGTREFPRIAALVRVAGLVVDQRVVALEPFRVRWTPRLLVARNLVAPFGAGRIQAPVMVVRLAPPPPLVGPPDPIRDALRDVAGAVTVEDVSVSTLRQLLTDSPYYASPDATTLRRILDEWRGPVFGRLGGIVRFGSLPDGLVEGREEEALTGWDGRPGTGRVEARLSAADLGTGEGPEAMTVRVTLRAAYEANRLEVEQALLESPDGARLSAAGVIEPATPRRPGSVRMLLSGQELSILTLSRLPWQGIRTRLDGIRPLDGRLSFQGEVSGTPDRPEGRLSARIALPVIGGVPLDEITLTEARYQAAAGRLTVSGIQVVKRRPGEALPGRFSVSGSLPVSWPDLVVSPQLPRDLTIQIPQQSLQVLNDLAEETDTLARRTGAEAAARVQT